MSRPELFSPLRLGPYLLPHRVVLAPLTRMRTLPGNVPSELNATYYSQRASAGLLITEATQVSPQGLGYPGTPGIHSREQIAGWRLVTDAVHARDARIFLQLWHVGRISHPTLQPGGGLPVAPSAVRPDGMAFTFDGLRPFETPRALDTYEIPGIVEDYRKGAENALAAGFDGVELHAANGYLIDQFLQDRTNRREDRYGGSVENRARFLLEIVAAVSGVFGANRVGVRLSPWGTFNDMGDSDPETLFSYVLKALSPLGLAYVHLVEPRVADPGGSDATNSGSPSPSARFRALFAGPVIAAGGFDRLSAMTAVAQGTADAIAFGRLFISNPDLPRRLMLGAPLNPYDRSSFYGGDARGYIDYPSLE